MFSYISYKEDFYPLNNKKVYFSLWKNFSKLCDNSLAKYLIQKTSIFKGQYNVLKDSYGTYKVELFFKQSSDSIHLTFSNSTRGTPNLVLEFAYPSFFEVLLNDIKSDKKVIRFKNELRKFVEEEILSKKKIFRTEKKEAYKNFVEDFLADGDRDKKIRINDLSKYLGISNNAIINIGQEINLNLTSHLNSVNCEEAIKIIKVSSNKKDNNISFKSHDERIFPGEKNYQRISKNSSSINKDFVETQSQLTIKKANKENQIKNSKNIQTSKISFQKNKLPIFIPSIARIPEGFADKNNLIDNFNYALLNPSISFQTFFNELELLSKKNSLTLLNDEVLNLPPFDEFIYCQIVQEMHKFSIAELRDNNQDKSNVKSKFGAIAGGLLGILQMNPFAPFIGASVGSNLGKNNLQKSKRIEEILPDPKLLFFKDNYSYLSIGRSQSPKTRRVIFAPVKKENGNIYFRVIPAIVTLDFVLPTQVFKIGSGDFFVRPIGAGITRNQANYDTVKIHRKYYHSRLGEGISEDTNQRIKVIGPDIEDINYKLYSYKSDNRDLNYLYFDYIKQPGYVY